MESSAPLLDLPVTIETGCRLKLVGADWRFVSGSEDAQGGASFLFEKRAAEDERRVIINTGIGEIPTGKVAAPRTYAIIDCRRGSQTTVEFGPTDIALDKIGRLSDGRFVVVGARCALREGGADENLLLVSKTGQIESSFTAGDGISDVIVDATDHVWLGYFDEGVFGNLGWGRPGTQEPLGACGVRVLNASGDEVWTHANTDPFFIADVYAMASVEDGIAVSAYGANDIVLLSRSASAVRLGAQWHEARSNAFALSSSWLMTLDRSEGCRLFCRESNGVRAVAQIQFTENFSGVWSGRGSRMNHFDASGWSYIDLKSVGDQFAQRV